MPYCANCGSEVSTGDRFCRNCGKEQGRSTQRTSERAAVGLDDVPRWLGWLALPVGVLTSAIGLGLYSYWAYRRGRRDGADRERTEPPYTSIGWRIVGWGLFALIPFAGWYAVVHVPTLCYKHGLRVGAELGEAPQGFTSLPALGAALAVPLAAIFAAAFAVGVALELQNESTSGSILSDEPIRSEEARSGPTWAVDRVSHWFFGLVGLTPTGLDIAANRQSCPATPSAEGYWRVYCADTGGEYVVNEEDGAVSTANLAAEAAILQWIALHEGLR